MRPSEIRRELLRQHAEIRILMDVVLTIAEDARAGSAGDDIRGCLARLVDAVRTHNLSEEALLGDLIPSVDAWGPARVEIMLDEHIQEHAQLYAALLETPFTPVELAAAGVVALIDLIGKHMDREEAAFLGEDVLRDDIVVVNQSAG